MADKGVRMGLVCVTWETFRQVLRLPDHVRIHGMSEVAGFGNNQVLFKLACDDFPPTPDGQMLPQFQPKYRTVTTTDGEQIDLFDGWEGLEGVTRE